MAGLGFGLFFVGYSLLAYGWSQVRGCNAGLFSLIVPGRFKGCNPDSGESTTKPAKPAAPKPPIPGIPQTKTPSPGKASPVPRLHGL